nr:MAG TPA: hypothetical protein [Caudoviricetes sp.]
MLWYLLRYIFQGYAINLYTLDTQACHKHLLSITTKRLFSLSALPLLFFVCLSFCSIFHHPL